MLYIHIKLPPRVTLPQIWGPRPIIQDLKNRPVLPWELLWGPKTVMVSPTNGLGGWFGWPPGVLQITHPMGPSTHPSGHRGSKRPKTSPSLEPFLGQCTILEFYENLSRNSFWAKNFFETVSGFGPMPEGTSKASPSWVTFFHVTFSNEHFSVNWQPIIG